MCENNNWIRTSEHGTPQIYTITTSLTNSFKDFSWIIIAFYFQILPICFFWSVVICEETLYCFNAKVTLLLAWSSNEWWVITGALTATHLWLLFFIDMLHRRSEVCCLLWTHSLCYVFRCLMKRSRFALSKSNPV